MEVLFQKGKRFSYIANLNINSLIKHFNEIRLFLEQNAIAINESKVDNFISDIEMHIACYNLNRKDRNRFGG